MPGLTLNTQDAVMQPPPAASSSSSSSARRSSSPTRPPVSPITPTMAHAQLPPQQQPLPPFSQTRQTYTHSQPDQVGMPPPPAPPEPISFDDNPDVLALKSAISILQMQKARAARDIQSLSSAKEAALANTEGFIADLRGGKVGTEADRLFPDLAPRRKATEPVEEEDSDSRDSSDSSDSSDDEDDTAEPSQQQGSASASTSTPSSPPKDGSNPAPTTTHSPKQKKKPNKKQKPPPAAPQPAWRTLPKPQNVVRCPPINWAQYGVVGESLDKLHAQQQRAPAQGVPATLKPGGEGGGLTYEFKGDVKGEQKALVGVAAPYNPQRDRLEKKGRGGKR
ncbi:hypothetical protein GE09DRAFT_787133 [Coniochaeta sp. 2T2.1]|nr:hypothetical protein GE09DRAFT_787133 [Coniochaeta sp. 2T2.1]